MGEITDGNRCIFNCTDCVGCIDPKSIDPDARTRDDGFRDEEREPGDQIREEMV